MSFLYLAYGSNMLTARLKRRCPSAKQICTALVASHGLEFTKPSSDRSGKATLVRDDSHDVFTPGVLFEIGKSDLPRLDRAEGNGQGYDRLDDFEVRLAATGERASAVTYLAIDTWPHLKPYDWYLALVVAGAHEHGLDPAHVEQLGRTEYWIDDRLTCPKRAEAMRALAAHGHENHLQLLGKTESIEEK